MSYQYVRFDNVPLPLYNHAQEHAPMPSEPTLLDSIGGAYDWRGSARRDGRKQVISGKGVLVGETVYLVDQSDNYLVDESGNYLIAGNSEQILVADVRALLEKKGKRGQLWRKRLEDSVEEWKTARLLSVSWPRKWEDHALIAELDYQFETQMEFWHAKTATQTTGSATAGTPKYLLVNNAGEMVQDAVITIARSSGTITAVSITGDGVSLNWTGSLGASDELVIDCGLQTVRKTGADAYSGFSLGVAHTAAGWLPLSPSANPIVVTVTGGNADVEIEHYNQYP